MLLVLSGCCLWNPYLDLSSSVSLSSTFLFSKSVFSNFYFCVSFVWLSCLLLEHESNVAVTAFEAAQTIPFFFFLNAAHCCCLFSVMAKRNCQKKYIYIRLCALETTKISCPGANCSFVPALLTSVYFSPLFPLFPCLSFSFGCSPIFLSFPLLHSFF